MIISFAWTTPALLAGAKTVTRRNWKSAHAAKFKAGDLVDAWDRSPRFGGRKVADIRLTRDPYLESTADAPDSDYAAEGFDYLERHQQTLDGAPASAVWRDWKEDPRHLYVVRFEPAEVSDG